MWGTGIGERALKCNFWWRLAFLARTRLGGFALFCVSDWENVRHTFARVGWNVAGSFFARTRLGEVGLLSARSCGSRLTPVRELDAFCPEPPTSDTAPVRYCVGLLCTELSI